MVEEIVFGNKSATSWECEPRKTKIGVCGLVIPEIHPPAPCSIKQLVSPTLLDGQNRGENSHQKAQICSGNSDPLFLNIDILHQVCGLTFQ